MGWSVFMNACPYFTAYLAAHFNFRNADKLVIKYIHN